MTVSENTHPILICGPTASGKSSLALELAKLTGGCVVNADALQVYDTWRVLTARPSIDDETRAQHHLYGHTPLKQRYSVGAWLRDVKKILSTTDKRPIIVGGTGLYFSALTEGLAEIPETPAEVRAIGNNIRERSYTSEFIEYLSKKDPESLSAIDKNNPMRLQRAWEVFETTGRGIQSWQSETGKPLVGIENANAMVLNSDTDWLNQRIKTRFDAMVELGALEECKNVLEMGWEPSLPSSRALGARELIAYLQGEIGLDDAKTQAMISTRQFAKRQRSWFRNRMKNWHQVSLSSETDIKMLATEVLDIPK